MVRVLGSSFERIMIRDLGDIIYYRQEKDYTDQQFESSKDLQREISKGRVTLLKKFSSHGNSNSGSSPTVINESSLNILDIKKAVKESIPAVDPKGLKEAVREMIPMIVDSVRQEVSSKLGNISVTSDSTPKTNVFRGPEYVPDVSSEGMVTQIQPEEREVSGDGIQDNLAALRRLKKSK